MCSLHGLFDPQLNLGTQIIPKYSYYLLDPQPKIAMILKIISF